MLKRLVCLLLPLLLMLSWAAADTAVTMKPYPGTAEENSYAELLGLNDPQAVYTFSASESLACIRVNVYALQEGRWLLASTQALPVTGSEGRLALACEHLEERLRIAVQTENGLEELVCHPLFGKPPASCQVTLSEGVGAPYDREIPLVLQSASDEGLSLVMPDDPASLQEPAYAVTIVFSTQPLS